MSKVYQPDFNRLMAVRRLFRRADRRLAMVGRGGLHHAAKLAGASARVPMDSAWRPAGTRRRVGQYNMLEDQITGRRREIQKRRRAGVDKNSVPAHGRRGANNRFPGNPGSKDRNETARLERHFQRRHPGLLLRLRRSGGNG